MLCVCAFFFSAVLCRATPFVLTASPNTPARPLVVPSKDYSHGGELAAPLIREEQTAGHGQRFRQKKAMNTTKDFSMKNISERRPSYSVQANQQRSHAEHNSNRELSTSRVLDYLKAQLPEQYELAEIVGKWVWLDFPKATHRAAANTLWRLGFHWNQRRCVWQHPCGAFAPYAPHPGEPRAKYGSEPAKAA